MKVSNDVDDVTIGDKFFHKRTGATENARSPIDECLVQGTININEVVGRLFTMPQIH